MLLPSDNGPISASLIVCESVLTERNGTFSGIRIMDFLACGSAAAVKFSVLTYLHCTPGDLSPHTITVDMTDASGAVVASTPATPFLYGYRRDPNGYGGFSLVSDFNLI